MLPKITTLESNRVTTPVDHSEELCRSLFQEIGENPLREGLLKTPERFRKAIMELTRGYHLSARDAVGEGIFETESNGPIFVRRIEFYSLCEHHILPFWGHASIGYVPTDKILGLSKLARVVEVFARRLQVQERLTREIGEAIQELVNAKAVVVSVEASHMCMMMRGVRKQDSTTRTEFHTGLESLSEHDVARLWKGIED